MSEDRSMDEHRLVKAVKEARAVAACDHDWKTQTDNIFRTVRYCRKCRATSTLLKHHPRA